MAPRGNPYVLFQNDRPERMERAYTDRRPAKKGVLLPGMPMQGKAGSPGMLPALPTVKSQPVSGR
jgi:hypothetical protein